MTKERALEIAAEIRKSGGWGSKSMTQDEREEIMAFWNTLPGYYSFYGAVRAMAEVDVPNNEVGGD